MTAGVCAGAGVLGLAAANDASADSGLGSGERADIEAVVRDYLMENPEVIIDALNAYRTREEQATRTEYEAELYSRATTPVLGNPDGDVTLVEFFDYNCGYCKAVAGSVATLIDEDPNLRVVMKEYPILSEGSVIAARAALASSVQGAYREMHEALMTHRGNFDIDTVMALAGDLGLDADRLRQDMESSWIGQEIVGNRQLAEQIGIRGTPAFIVGDDFLPGAAELETLRQLIDDNRSAS
ncbi:DsbA family protein [Fodinicurvata sp. EGI_FJ10296]|uniref:DsbA family protein n=1 Tax=Fodinicurvata sp. EGI_FJ10296 TaxID=3231908 RepID=UPI003454834E